MAQRKEQSAEPRARLYQHTSPAEVHLWRLLRKGQLGGVLFRRRQPIGPYIVDFYCPGASLVIEIDLSDASSALAVQRAALRQHALEKRGFAVLRIKAADVFFRTSYVLEQIAEAAGIESSGLHKR
ncbi:MAG: DUF559 domain-containing protein [Myxococcales bacterium]|nr:MAG: DUF559 domain-containing protein [Myxococcales bacterium]